MPDGPIKTAEAMKIFGRAGAELIPLLNEGGAKIQELQGHFTALNAVISGQAVILFCSVPSAVAKLSISADNC